MLKFYLLLLGFTVSHVIYAQNSGWLLPKNDLKLITYYGRYDANSYKDDKGNTIKYADGGKFSSDYFKVSGEYGISNNTNILMSVPVVYNAQKNNNFGNYKLALGDLDLRLAANLIKWKQSYLIGEIKVNIPLYSKNSIPNIGLGEYGAGASLKYCGSIDPQYKFFFNIEQGIHLYFDNIIWWNNAAQIGYNISKKHTLLSEISGVQSFDKGTFNISPSANRANFFYEKVALGYYFKPTNKIQFGGTLWSDFINKKSSIGKGFSAIVIIII